ncbi:hypothetical protein GJA_909 [Janthinobacterium agaricidamnosum NBRC 102515 = DSM 9628]|uniref:Uncharacterized protein n=1 Tax=Janthinobacterium agaricidamnosum NBRC 102515 = DSM 9628 TaxID=1349767 RepID=W0V1T2_9BURK|nr:hypothetical protein GJA_909 [Janthinobacterium agaricidamnosum NBRC 102515 = DSM 9628]
MAAQHGGGGGAALLNLRIKPRHRLVREKPLPLAVSAQINET